MEKSIVELFESWNVLEARYIIIVYTCSGTAFAATFTLGVENQKHFAIQNDDHFDYILFNFTHTLCVNNQFVARLHFTWKITQWLLMRQTHPYLVIVAVENLKLHHTLWRRPLPYWHRRMLHYLLKLFQQNRMKITHYLVNIKM